MVDVPGGAVHHPAGRHADPQRTATVPATAVAADAVGQRGQSRGLRTRCGRRLDRIEGATEQVTGHDAGGSRSDMYPESEVRLVIDLDRNARPADGSRYRQIGSLAHQLRIEQCADLTVHRGDRQSGGRGDGVPGHRTAPADGGEDRGRGGFRLGQGGCDDVVQHGGVHRTGGAHRPETISVGGGAHENPCECRGRGGGRAAPATSEGTRDQAQRNT